MPTSFFFNNQEIIIPGAYSQVKSGIQNPALAFSFGNTLIIDTGISNKGGLFGGGAGINGTLSSGKNAHYTFDNVRDFRNLVKGGPLWTLAGQLFVPGGGATAGISSLTYIRAKTTTPASITVPFGAQDDSDTDLDSTNNGSVTIQVKDEGFVGNGVLGDESRATATLTVTNAGATGNVVSIQIDGITVGSYTVKSGDNIALVVAGIAASITKTGIAEVISTSSTQVVIYAPHGYAATLNSTPATTTITGSVAVTSSNFTGGAEGTKLTRGYAATVVAGVVDPSKYILKFWRGTYKGTDSGLIAAGTATPIDGLAELSSVAELIVQSPEVSTVQELVTWMQDTAGTGFEFSRYLYLSSHTIASVTDEILDQDLTNNYIKATGGVETYSSSDLADVLDSISDLNFDFVLADRFGDDARDAANISILNFIANTAKIKPDLYVSSGSVAGEFASSLSVSAAYDSQYVTVVHGGARVTDIGGRNFKEYDSIYKAATLLGREAGLEPQVPLTLKNIGIQGELHTLTVTEQERALRAGVLITKISGSSFEVVKGVNSLQNNTYIVNPDGTTHSKQLRRIVRQINKELTINARNILLKNPIGANSNTVSDEDVKAFVESFLGQRVATRADDNLIISFQNVEVTRNQDAYEVVYQIVPNSEVSFLFFVAFLIDPS